MIDTEIDKTPDADDQDILKHPSHLHLIASTIWPSFKRVLSAIFSIIGFPLFLLAIIGASKALDELGLLNLGETGRRLLAVYESAQDLLLQQVSSIGLEIPALVFSGLVIYLSTGNTIAKSERREILAVQLDRSEWRSSFKQAFQKFRIDSAFYLLPRILRGVVMRILWPLVALHRLSTPFVIEGPGPSGDWISSSVRRRDLDDFARMVSASGVWTEQIVYDQRQILIWHVLLVAGGSWMVKAASSFIVAV